jgi:hypothetical protein
VHKGRTTRTPWDPVLVQKTIATSPASQAGSTGYCSRKYLGGARRATIQDINPVRKKAVASDEWLVARKY